MTTVAVVAGNPKPASRPLDAAIPGREGKGIPGSGWEPQRSQIPPAVMQEVFTRDGGRCVECGGQEDFSSIT